MSAFGVRGDVESHLSLVGPESLERGLPQFVSQQFLEEDRVFSVHDPPRHTPQQRSHHPWMQQMQLSAPVATVLHQQRLSRHPSKSGSTLGSYVGPGPRNGGYLTAP